MRETILIIKEEDVTQKHKNEHDDSRNGKRVNVFIISEKRAFLIHVQRFL